MALKRKPKGKATKPPAVVDLDAATEAIAAQATAHAATLGVEVIVVVLTPGGDWRAKWGQIGIDRATWFVFRLLTAMQRMLP